MDDLELSRLDVNLIISECYSEFCDVVGDSPCGCDGCPYGVYGDENCYEAYKRNKLEEYENG